jgi:sugar/nucleoside kinase (ribokinase family)
MRETGSRSGPGVGHQGRHRPGPDVVVVGNVTIDDIVRANGETTMASPGGNTLHVAIGVRIWGVPVGVVARVGADFPEPALEQLSGAGVDTLGLQRVAGPTVRNWVVYEEDGRRSWVYRTPPERSLEVAPRPEDLPAEWAGQPGHTPVVHVAAMPFSSAVRIVEHVRASGPAVVTMDTHEAWTVGRAEVFALARQVDVFLPSREELACIVGYDDPERACRELLEEGVPAVVVKCGSAGAVLGTAKGGVSSVAAAEVDVSDATGAGDSFCGGLRPVWPSARSWWSPPNAVPRRRGQRSALAVRCACSAAEASRSGCSLVTSRASRPGRSPSPSLARETTAT